MDKILRTLICGGQVSLTVLDTTKLVQRAMDIHNVDGKSAEILGGLLTCGAYLASSLKSERGSVSLTVKADGGDGAVSVSADAALHVRGYADGACNESLKGGSLTVVREDGFSSMPFIGNCEIESDDISDLLELYFGQSEQIPTAVKINVLTENGKCKFAGGVVMQLLPDAEDENVDRAGEAFYSFKEGEACGTADGVYEKYFKNLSDGELTTLFPEYKCNCSENKITGVLASVGKSELLDICREQGAVSVHCHYCNKDYVFDQKRIEELF